MEEVLSQFLHKKKLDKEWFDKCNKIKKKNHVKRKINKSLQFGDKTS